MQILELGLLVLASYFGGRLARKMRIGEVIGQILGGILIGPHFLLLVNRWLTSHPAIAGLKVMHPLSAFFETRFEDYMGIMEGMHFFVFLFLGIVAFSLGEELHWNRLKQVGFKASLICLLQAFTTWFALTMVFRFIFHTSWIVALLIGSIGIATAPALTFILMSKYKVEGQLKNILANIVVLDDVIEVIVFSITLSVAVAMKSGIHISVQHIITDLGLEIGLAILLGFLLYLFLRFAIRSYTHEHPLSDDDSDESLLSTVLSDHPTPSVEIFLIIIGAVAVIIALAMNLDLPFLVVAVVAGIFVANFHTNALFDSLKLKDVMPVFNLLFFGIIGASVQIETFSFETVFFVLGYFVIRTIAKLAGNWIGCRITGQDPKITASIPKLMLPQAGMAAVETILVARTLGGADGELIFNTIVPALVIFELVGAYLSEQTLIKWKEWVIGEKEAIQSAGISIQSGDESAIHEMMPLPVMTLEERDGGYSKTEVIEHLLDTLFERRYITDREYTRNAIFEREQLGSTVLIDQVALPHCRSEAIDEPVIIGCRLPSPVLWNIKPDKKVKLVFMIISPKQKPEDHLRALQWLARALSSGELSHLSVDSATT